MLEIITFCIAFCCSGEGIAIFGGLNIWFPIIGFCWGSPCCNADWAFCRDSSFFLFSYSLLVDFYSNITIFLGISCLCCCCCCFMTYFIFISITFCCIFLIITAASSGWISLFFNLVSIESNYLYSYYWSLNCIFICANICSWIIFCCSGGGFIGEPFFITNYCIFIIVFCCFCKSLRPGD